MPSRMTIPDEIAPRPAFHSLRPMVMSPPEVVVAASGFALQNRMRGFTLEPGHPNEVAPAKRPLHTLCCSVVLREGRLALAYAIPGGHAQTQTLNNLTVFGMDVQEALEARGSPMNPAGCLSRPACRVRSGRDWRAAGTR